MSPATTNTTLSTFAIFINSTNSITTTTQKQMSTQTIYASPLTNSPTGPSISYSTENSAAAGEMTTKVETQQNAQFDNGMNTNFTSSTHYDVPKNNANCVLMRIEPLENLDDDSFSSSPSEASQDILTKQEINNEVAKFTTSKTVSAEAETFESNILLDILVPENEIKFENDDTITTNVDRKD